MKGAPNLETMDGAMVVCEKGFTCHGLCVPAAPCHEKHVLYFFPSHHHPLLGAQERIQKAASSSLDGVDGRGSVFAEEGVSEC